MKLRLICTLALALFSAASFAGSHEDHASCKEALGKLEASSKEFGHHGKEHYKNAKRAYKKNDYKECAHEANKALSSLKD